MMEREKIARAKRHVKAVTGFYIHFGIFVAVIALLVVVNLAAGRVWWVQWPFLGWGAGVLAHAWAVFGRAPRALARWQARKVRETGDKA